MSALPGLQPESPDHLLGVRPLERSEAIARVLRFECTPWEAHAYYRDSQSLYQRQRLALLLQGLYRRREARSIAKARLHAQRQARYSLSSIRPRMLAAINHWRSRWLWRCFGAWRSELYHSWRVLDKAFSAVRRLSNLDLSRALNTWAQTVRERRQAFQLLKQAVRSWLQRCFARGFRTWASHSKAQQRAFRGLRRAVMAILLRELRLALTTWQSTMHSRKRVPPSPPPSARIFSSLLPHGTAVFSKHRHDSFPRITQFPGDPHSSSPRPCAGDAAVALYAQHMGEPKTGKLLASLAQRRPDHGTGAHSRKGPQ